MFKIYEIDYHGRTWLVGEAENMKDARFMARTALKKSCGEFPVFISCNGRCVG